MFKKAFTLIELLGVLIILAVIALITFPVIDNSIKNSREQALKRTIDSIEEAAYQYSIQNDLGYPTDKQPLYITDMQTQGFLDKEIINPVNNEILSGCVWYYWDTTYSQYSFEYDKDCMKVDTEPEINITYNEGLINSNGWAKENIAVTLIGNGEVKYCLSSSECEPNEVVENGSNTKFITSEGTSYICATTTNTLGTSNRSCQSFNLDKTAPTINGLTQITVERNEEVDLNTGVTTDDNLSGVDGTYTINPSSVDTSTAGIKTVTYTVKDLAGNTVSEKRTIQVEGELPTIVFKVEGNPFNSNNWSKENVTVRINVTDNSGLGIKEIKYCKGTAECEPNTLINNNESVILEENSASNQVCVLATDNNETSNKICSNNYQIDKILPTISGLNKITVNIGETINLTSGVSANDTLSQIDGTYTYSPTSVSNTTVGTTVVTYRVKDLAGNEAVETRQVEVLGDAPNIVFDTTGTFNSNGWAKANFYVQADVTDNSNKGISSIKWCSTTGTSCTPTTTTNDVNVLISSESETNKVCVEAIDNNGKTTTLCSDSYKLDKTLPTITGVGDLTVQRGEVVNLSNGVNATDALSGIDGTISISPSTVDTSVTGTKQVTYRVSDQAGNVREVVRNIIVDAEAPTIVFNLVDGSAINSNGWAKENFYVRATVTDNSGSGMASGSSCTTNSSSECTPSASFTGTTKDFYISTEGSNRACVQVTDNNNKTTKVCSDTYKLDKTAPTAGTATFGGTLGSNNWYTGNVTVNVANGSDSLSGHLSTTSSVASITSNTTGTTVRITTTDLAGNSSTRNYTIKIDKNNPTAPTITGGSTSWSSTAKTIRVSTASTSTSGIKNYQYYISTSSSSQTGGSWKNLASGTTSVSISTNGTRYIYFRAVNNAGKTSSISSAQTTKIDTGTPTAPTITGGSKSWSSTAKTIRVSTASTSTSGIKNYQYYISTSSSRQTGGSWTNLASGTTSVSISTSGTRYIFFRAVNNAGKTGTISSAQTTKIDTTQPALRAKASSNTIDKGTSAAPMNYFTITTNYNSSLSGGTTTCKVGNTTITNVSSLATGTHTLTCTMRTGAGKTASASTTIVVNYKDGSGANKPELASNMIPIKYNGSNWVYADISEEWYDYNSKEWANAVVLNNGVSKSVGQTISESEIALWYVWIPRYKYQLFNANNGSVDEQLINVTFESGTASTGTVSCTDAVSKSGSSSQTCTNASNGNWYTHPAFTFGSEQVSGFWVGKFEVSGSTSKITVKPGVSSLRNTTVSAFFTAIQNIKSSYSLSGDSHMMKNMEWGAVAYLKQSKYGLGITDIAINNNSSYYTGGGSNITSYKSNTGQSTTGNVYGIYDMSGGAYEYVMGNMVNSSGAFYSQSSGFSSAPNAKYYDKYTYNSSNTTYGRGKLGDATKETLSSFGSTSGGWYGNYAYFVSGGSWFMRGGYYYDYYYYGGAGVFYFGDSRGGGTNSYISARAVLIP